MNENELKELRIEWANLQSKVYKLQKTVNEKKETYINELIEWANLRGVDVGLGEINGREVIFISAGDVGMYTLPENPMLINIILGFDDEEKLHKDMLMEMTQ